MFLVVGDVHGCLTELDELLAVTSFRPGQDTLVLLGDLVDRGPDSLGVLSRAQELQAHCVLGNHEDIYLRYRAHEIEEYQNPEYQNPVNLTYPKSELYRKFRAQDWVFMESLPASISLSVGKHIYTFLHAGVDPHLASFDEQTSNTLTRIRYVDIESKKIVGWRAYLQNPDRMKLWADLYDGRFGSIIYGHTSFDTPTYHRCSEGNWFTLGLDTGVCFGGSLSGAIFTPQGIHSIVSVPAKQAYAQLKEWSTNWC